MEAKFEKNIARGSGTFYKIYNNTLRRIVRDELSRRIVRAELSCAELSAPNCPRRIVLRRIVRTPNDHIWTVCRDLKQWRTEGVGGRGDSLREALSKGAVLSQRGRQKK